MVPSTDRQAAVDDIVPESDRNHEVVEGLVQNHEGKG